MQNCKYIKKSLELSFKASSKQGMRESNSHQRFWRPLSYHLTNPLFYEEKVTITSHVSLKGFVPSKLHTCYILMESFYLCVSPAATLQSPFSFLGQALTLLVTVSSVHYCTSTPALSTSSSSRGFTSFEWDISS